MIRLTYDPAADALMIAFDETAKTAKTVRASETVRVDFDKAGRAIGVEVLDATFHVGAERLAQLPGAARMMTLEEAARESGRAASTLRIQINAGRLEGEKRGRDWYVSEASLLTYLDNLPPQGRRPAAKRAPAKRAGARGAKSR